ncbi:hypothetical protein IEQ34_011763 [Dendrobium chrysotoxum]|uniref:Uncharacterized protein n=1 Tax=Dendrobium chrysotoxum TaxID=161865 RepID=A0AAV7GT69_DENCH|nr:hypothetical protein IEQ34_011763 [Dendrobium chrysotoxum]
MRGRRKKRRRKGREEFGSCRPPPEFFLTTTGVPADHRQSFLLTTAGVPSDHRRSSCRPPPEFFLTAAGVPTDNRQSSCRPPPEFLLTTAGVLVDHRWTSSSLPTTAELLSGHRQSSFRPPPEFVPTTAGVPSDHLRSSCRPPLEFLLTTAGVLPGHYRTSKNKTKPKGAHQRRQLIGGQRALIGRIMCQIVCQRELIGSWRELVTGRIPAQLAGVEAESDTEVVYASTDQVFASDGLRFEVNFDGEKSLKWIFLRDVRWGLECELIGLNMLMQISVVTDQGVLIRERVKLRRNRFCQKLSVIQEDDEEEMVESNYLKHEHGIDDGNEVGNKGVSWAINIRNLVASLGVGLFIFRAPLKRLVR